MEERNMSGKEIMYYAIQISDMTIWVPADGMLNNRLRVPTSENGFKKLKNILSSPGEPLPDDRHLRKTMLLELLKDGSAESLCRVIRSLVTYRKAHSLNENDQALLKRSEKALIGEWGIALSVTPIQAEIELQHLLSSGSTGD
jgi:RNA polymerase-interacting CarD/CdnL/TRCF family regulator